VFRLSLKGTTPARKCSNELVRILATSDFTKCLREAERFRLNVRAVFGGNEQTVLRLGAALLLGSILGLNRELHGKAAGLRTHALVCLGAAIATLLALGPSNARVTDPNAITRVVQGILTGVGFLGAGVILRDPMGHVTGLTTAATIWICAVLGIVCGLGYWALLGIAVVITLLVLVFGRPIERLAEKLFHRHATQPPDHSV
jgi:putative Mg2+ transporter-C (MgtC) family protein